MSTVHQKEHAQADEDETEHEHKKTAHFAAAHGPLGVGKQHDPERNTPKRESAYESVENSHSRRVLNPGRGVF